MINIRQKGEGGIRIDYNPSTKEMDEIVTYKGVKCFFSEWNNNIVLIPVSSTDTIGDKPGISLTFEKK